MSEIRQQTLVNLPAVLFAEILSRWLDFRPLVRLDSAACNHKIRVTLLELIASSQCVFASSVNLEDSAAVVWFRSRKLQVSNLTVSACFPELAKYLRSHFSSIRHLTCLCSEAVGMANSYIRNLVTLTFRNITAVPQLSDILWLNSDLQELYLEDVCDLETGHFDELHLPQLRLLSLRGSACDDELLGVIVRSTEVLQKIDIGNCNLISDAGVILLAQCCPLLRSLGVSELPITDGALIQLTQLCPNITSLELSVNGVVTDLGVLAIAGNLNNLRSISINSCNSLTDVSVEHLTRCNASTLQVLHATSLPTVRVDVLVALLQKCSCLHTLSLDCDLNVYHADIVPHMRNLECLTVYTALSDDSLCLIAQHCKKLKQLGNFYATCTYLEPDEEFGETFTTADETEEGPSNEVIVDTIRVMHSAATLPDPGITYTEKGLLALMDGLPQLQVLGVRSEELSQGQLPPFAQTVWRRLRPHIAFVDNPDCFHFNPLLE